MRSQLWRLSPHFWIEKIHNISETVNSMHEHGGFDVLCNHWTVQDRQDCFTELDELSEALARWKAQLQEDLCEATQPLEPLPLASAGKTPHLRIASYGPSPRVLSFPPETRTS